MELSLNGQAAGLGLGFLLGLALGLSYDLLRPLRRRFGGPGWDLLFAGLCFAAAFLYGLWGREGRLELWELAALGLGFRLYLGPFSRCFLPLYQRLLRFLAGIFRRGKAFVKKCCDLLKFFFQKRR